MPKPFTKITNKNYSGAINKHIRGLSKKDFWEFNEIKKQWDFESDRDVLRFLILISKDIASLNKIDAAVKKVKAKQHYKGVNQND